METIILVTRTKSSTKRLYQVSGFFFSNLQMTHVSDTIASEGGILSQSESIIAGFNLPTLAPLQSAISTPPSNPTANSTVVSSPSPRPLNNDHMLSVLSGQGFRQQYQGPVSQHTTSSRNALPLQSQENLQVHPLASTLAGKHTVGLSLSIGLLDQESFNSCSFLFSD